MKIVMYVFVTLALPVTWVLDTAVWVVQTIREEFRYRPGHVSYREAYRIVRRKW